MPNDGWQRWESPLEQSAVEALAALQASVVRGPSRRDPQGTFRYETGSRTAPQRASATGSSVETNRRSRGSDGTFAYPIEHTLNVAPFGVSAVTAWRMSTERARGAEVSAYEVQETDGVDPSSLRASQATVGDRCPGDDTMNRLRVAAMR